MKSIKNIAIVFLVITNLCFLIYAFYQHTLKTKTENEIANCHSELIMARELAEQAKEIAQQQTAIAQEARAEALKRFKEAQEK